MSHAAVWGKKTHTHTNCSLSNVLCCTGWSRFRRYFSSDMSNPASRPLLREKWKRNDWNDWMWLYGGCLGSRALYHRLQVHILRCYFRFSLGLLWFWIHDGFFFFFYMEEDVKVGFYSAADPVLIMLPCVLKCVGLHRCNTKLMWESKGSCNFNPLLLFFFPLTKTVISLYNDDCNLPLHHGKYILYL